MSPRQARAYRNDNHSSLMTSIGSIVASTPVPAAALSTRFPPIPGNATMRSVDIHWTACLSVQFGRAHREHPGRPRKAAALSTSQGAPVSGSG